MPQPQLIEAVIHVHRVTGEPTPERTLVATLQPEHTAEPVNRPLYCGVVADGGLQCEALSIAKKARCPKEAVARLESRDGPVHLCGGHTIVHRKGNPVTLPDR